MATSKAKRGSSAASQGVRRTPTRKNDASSSGSRSKSSHSSTKNRGR